MPFVQEDAGTLLFVYHRKKLAVGNPFLSPFPDQDHVQVFWRAEKGTESLGARVLGSCELYYMGIRILWNISNHSELPELSLRPSFTSFQKKIHFAESSGKKHVWNSIKLRGTSKESCSNSRCGVGTNCHWSLEGIVHNEASHVSDGHMALLGGCSVRLWRRALHTIGQFWGPHAIYGPEQGILLVCLFKVITAHVSKTRHICTGEK